MNLCDFFLENREALWTLFDERIDSYTYLPAPNIVDSVHFARIVVEKHPVVRRLSTADREAVAATTKRLKQQAWRTPDEPRETGTGSAASGLVREPGGSSGSAGSGERPATPKPMPILKATPRKVILIDHEDEEAAASGPVTAALEAQRNRALLEELRAAQAGEVGQAVATLQEETQT